MDLLYLTGRRPSDTLALSELAIKAKSAGDSRQAQRQLGHTTVSMAEHYTRKRKGDKVTPTR
nr:hypothetical protein [Stenotrophomonas humi]